MAHKDEYEVARLYADASFEAALNDRFQGDFDVNYHLAPTWLTRRDPDTGKANKLRFPGATRYLFKALSALKGLRGTALDPFRFQADRRKAASARAHFEQLMSAIAPRITADNLDVAVELAALSMELRGYGHVFEANLERVQAEEEKTLRRFETASMPKLGKVVLAA